MSSEALAPLALARTVIADVPAAIVISHQSTRTIALANAAAAVLFSTDTATLETKTVDDLTHPQFRAELPANFHHSSLTDGFVTVKRYLRADGAAFMGVLRATPFPFIEDHVCAVITAVEETDRLRSKMTRAASIDPLTGVLRRESFLEAADVSRSAVDHFGLLFLDLDDFKELNDAFGHDLGDQVLGVIADRLRSSARSTDLVGRFGGDEFLILAMHVDEPDALARLVSQLESKLEAPITTDVGPVQVRASIGAVHCTRNIAVERAVTEADAAMYRRKRERKTGVFEEFTPAEITLLRD